MHLGTETIATDASADSLDPPQDGLGQESNYRLSTTSFYCNWEAVEAALSPLYPAALKCAGPFPFSLHLLIPSAQPRVPLEKGMGKVITVHSYSGTGEFFLNWTLIILQSVTSGGGNWLIYGN